MTEWATARGVRLSPDFNLNYAEEIGTLLANMMEEGIISRFEGGPETVYGIAEGQAPIASFYRNTIVHFFLTRAVAELGLLAVSEQRESSESLSQFWSEVQELRDLFKFEFFYPDTQLFEQQIEAELCRDEPNWQALLSENPDNARLIVNRLSPTLGHVALTVFAEAYSIGTDILIRHSGGEPMEEGAFIERCMSYGKQAYLQRRISSEASIGKLLFANAWKMLVSRGLITDADGRSRQAEALNQLIRRLEVIRALSIADRGASTLRDVARETL